MDAILILYVYEAYALTEQLTDKNNGLNNDTDEEMLSECSKLIR